MCAAHIYRRYLIGSRCIMPWCVFDYFFFNNAMMNKLEYQRWLKCPAHSSRSTETGTSPDLGISALKKTRWIQEGNTFLALVPSFNEVIAWHPVGPAGRFTAEAISSLALSCHLTSYCYNHQVQTKTDHRLEGCSVMTRPSVSSKGRTALMAHSHGWDMNWTLRPSPSQFDIF